MLTAEVDGQKLSEDEVVSTAILLLNAGHEATVHTTGNAVKTILESGLDPKTLFADEAQTAATVEECLRFDAPLHMFTRYALSDIDARGRAELQEGRHHRPDARRRQSRPDALQGRQPLRSVPHRRAECQLRRRHPFLHRRAAGAHRAADRARHAVQAPARPEARRRAALQQRLPFPRPGTTRRQPGDISHAASA